MDLQRLLLIGAIAILSFMLLTEWVAFKDAKTLAATENSSRLLPENPVSNPSSAPSIDDMESTVSDLPSAPESIEDAPAQVATTETGIALCVFTPTYCNSPST